MTANRPRVDPAVTPGTTTAGVTATRTRGVARSAGNPGPTTAQLINSSDASVSRTTYAALGITLHHFTDLLPSTIGLDVRHRATTVLTKQVLQLLDERDDALDEIERLVTDPGRRALPDGSTARDVCVDAWGDVQATAAERAAASREGAVEFGHEAIVNLAAVRGVGAIVPWWGTPMWRQRVELLPSDTIAPGDRQLLLDDPELADGDLLAAALGDAEPGRVSSAAPPRSAAEASELAPSERAALAG